MSASTNAALSRFVYKYKGIEGFYFLNKRGELGHIKTDDLRSVKETFPQLNDRDFLKAHPHFLDELEEFLRDVGDLCALYGGTHDERIELGYVLPANDNGQTWRSATLVLHKNVVDTIRDDENLSYSKVVEEPLLADQEAEKMQGVRSIQRGLDDLVNHRDPFGHYRFFPVLFVASELQPRREPDGDAQAPCSGGTPLRVLNLRWRSGAATGDSIESEHTSPRLDTLFAVLRDNLVRNGAIDRSRRLGHRLPVG